MPSDATDAYAQDGGSLIRRFLGFNQTLCRAFDRALPAHWRLDSGEAFMQTCVRPRVRPGTVVADVGGGKTPFFTAEEKQRLGLRVIGLDVSAAELRSAPPGAYDTVITADLQTWRGGAQADVCICMTVLEHVCDTGQAMAGLASMCRPGGRVLILVPCRSAVFAWLNRRLPQGLKEFLLFTIFPGTRVRQGFPAYYDRCTPAGFTALARACGLRVEERALYYRSDYFTFFFPLYAVWRLYQLAAYAVLGPEQCEAFSLVLKNAEEAP